MPLLTVRGMLSGACVGGVIALSRLGGQPPVVPDTAELSSAQRARLDAGGSVLITRPHPASPWPAATVYLFVEATPEEAAAVFTDYEQHSSYLPDVKRSRVSRAISSSVVEIDYVLAMPVVSDEEYTVRNRLRAERDGRYRVDWTLVRARSTKGTVGYVRFSPYTNARTRKSGTLMEYHNLVTPGSRLATLDFIKNRAIRQVEETAQAIARKAENVRKRDGPMRSRLAAFRAALAASPPKD